MNRRWASLAFVTLLAYLAGCGVTPSDGPEALPTSLVPAATAAPSSTASTGLTTPVYFAKNDRLFAVRRTVEQPPRPALALAAVLAGPSSTETRSGIRTALPPGLSPSIRAGGDMTVVVLQRESLEVPAGEQVLAIAQLVWTLTAPPGAPPDVRFAVGSEDIAVPVDGGRLESGPVTRTDYQSVAPR